MSKSASGKRLHLLHLHSTFDAGGKERRSTSLINRFGKAVDHSIVSAQPGALGARAQIDAGLSVHFPFGFPSLQGRFGVRRLQTLARAMQGFDLILTYNWGAMDAAMAHAMFGPTLGLAPLIHHEDGFNADEAKKLKTSRNWYRRVALARASALIVPSRQLERVALDVWHQPAGRVHRIGNGIPVKDYEPAKAKRVRPDALPRVVKRPGEKWLGTLAGLRPVKALPRLVRAFRSLPDDWQLVIVGEGPEREAIMAEAMKLEIGHRVHLPGFVAKPADATALFDLFALSSDSEQFPLSVVEAMASGLAVASPAVGDVADIVAAENAPFITPPGDEAALGAALLQLASDEALRRRIGAANQLRAREEFDEAVMVRHHGAIYAAALGLPSFP
ncbi:glycosyl transferase family 1 [Novosphingobium sediminis]|uniref:Glycosyl transferase family 1 n=1 Tax=Novosphingobium sediminis TaxID=707214 RepID=A0A512AI48_9SPHN|nr:glycosyltransferase family 4 protein [Novosphingobium sediminis]GEN99353.1 glycosyl transferase family 1 [Novosphingobium sediminis]